MLTQHKFITRSRNNLNQINLIFIKLSFINVSNFVLGPRFVLQPIRIFKGSFCGETLWENPFYVTPAKVKFKLKIYNNNTI